MNCNKLLSELWNDKRRLSSISHTVIALRWNWMDGWPRCHEQSALMAREFHIDKLSDEFGQYLLIIKCEACGHERSSDPHTLGRLCGWDAKLEDLAPRMRCSKCGKKKSSLRAIPPTRPRGYKSLPN